jgi:hypothetical protein
MIYRTLGATGLHVSQLGFGAMRLPMHGEGDARRVDRDLAFPMLERALAGGVNYFDTAAGYCNGDSQRVLGEFLRGRREQVVLSTKNPCYADDGDEWLRLLEQSLERLRTDHIDIYNHHGISWERYCSVVEPKLSRRMRNAKEQGLIRHICCSFHDNNASLVKLADTGYPDVLTVQYNLLDQSLAEGIAHAHARGIGIVVMGPVGGGRLGVDSTVLEELVADVKRVPDLALRFVLANPNVDVALSGMSTMAHVDENLRVASDGRALTPDETKSLDVHLQRLKAMSDLYCSGCGYCKPCPQEVDISAVFQTFNQGRVYGLWDNARERYRNLVKGGHSADRCVKCGACEPKCPQNISIADELERAARALG